MATPDWEAIEAAYRAGSLSIRAIGKRYHVSDTAIRKKAIQRHWLRDLTDKVKTATHIQLVRKGGLHAPTVRTETDIIHAAADEAASVVLSHRIDLAGWRQIAANLKGFLMDTVITEDNHTALARTFSAGVEAQLKLIKGEREAYNLNHEATPGTDNALAQWMKELAEGDAHGNRPRSENKISGSVSALMIKDRKLLI
ncbi:hypothetical protein [Candidatus Regiella endosymbiont of Tuberolachnus salignus]|uniref:hypothetical protein n=1 Tax=Candidatus Regiella endosymbiont of Tuberolachnus salignus TaxID=3077956 RepID=UPI0030CB7F67